MSKISFAPGTDSNVQGYVMSELQRLAGVAGDLLITSALRSGDTGEHGKGLAVDVVPAPGNSISLLDLYLLAERCAFKGIGVYPNWDNDAKGTKSGGLHLDLRSGPAARWLGAGSGKQQQYLALTSANLKAHGVI